MVNRIPLQVCSHSRADVVSTPVTPALIPGSCGKGEWWRAGDPDQAFEAVLAGVDRRALRTATRALLEVYRTSSRLALVLEPGTPRGYAGVLAARSLLVASGWHVLAPLPAGRSIPVAGRRGDWCHFAARLDRSALHRP